MAHALSYLHFDQILSKLFLQTLRLYDYHLLLLMKLGRRGAELLQTLSKYLQLALYFVHSVLHLLIDHFYIRILHLYIRWVCRIVWVLDTNARAYIFYRHFVWHVLSSRYMMRAGRRNRPIHTQTYLAGQPTIRQQISQNCQLEKKSQIWFNWLRK